MPKNNIEQRGIAPENWHYLKVQPKFGSLTDNLDLSFRGANEKELGNKSMDTLRETVIGLVEFHTDENGFGILADEIGIGLFYKNDGKLADLGIDLTKYCNNCSEKEMEKMGGGALGEVLAMMTEENQQILFSFDFRDNVVAVAEVDKRTGTGPIISCSQKVDLSASSIMTAHYNEYKICMGFHLEEDIFNFGLFAMREGEEFTPDTRIMVTRILVDCNYKTFLSSESPEKYRKLTDRIFFVGH